MTYRYSPDVLALNPQLTGDTAGKKGDKPATPSKYRNVRTEANGMTFSSGHEADVINKLILAEEQKAIFALRLQVRFPLSGGVVYVADAVFLEVKDGALVPVVADAKGFRDKVYKMKKKMMKAEYGIEITEM